MQPTLNRGVHIIPSDIPNREIQQAEFHDFACRIVCFGQHRELFIYSQIP